MYHETKEQAQKVAEKLAEDDRVAHADPQFEPYNGWVVRVTPKPIDLSEYADIAEIADGRDRPKPKKRKPEPVEAASVNTSNSVVDYAPLVLRPTGDTSKLPKSGICHEILGFYDEGETRNTEGMLHILRMNITPKRKSSFWETDPNGYLVDWISWMHKKGALEIVNQG